MRAAFRGRANRFVALTRAEKGEPYKGHDVRLNSLSELIVTLAKSPGLHVRRSLGVSRR